MADRNAAGRFVRGNKAALGNNGGRPPRAREFSYLDAIRNAVPPAELEAALRDALKHAQGGPKQLQHLTALLKLVLSYTTGKPAEMVMVQGDPELPIRHEVTFTETDAWRGQMPDAQNDDTTTDDDDE